MPLNQAKSFNSLETKKYSSYQKQSQEYRPTLGGLKFYNTDPDAITQSALMTAMWNGMLKFYIVPRTIISAGKYDWDIKSSTAIYFNPHKAKMFSDILKRYKENPESNDGLGVICGKSLITINNGKSFDKESYHSALRIIRFNKENSVEAEAAYQLNTDYYPMISQVGITDGVINYQQNTHAFQDIELDMIIDQLDQFVLSMTNAMAYSYMDATNKESQRIRNGIDNIITRVGAEPAWKKINKKANPTTAQDQYMQNLFDEEDNPTDNEPSEDIKNAFNDF